METKEAELLGMDHLAVMASMQARIDAVLMARHGVPLSAALTRAKARSQHLFEAGLPGHVIAATVAETYAAVGVAQ